MRPLLLLLCLLSLACGRNTFSGVQAVGDTARVASGAHVGKIKADIVIIQTGQGNSASTTDNSKAGQKGGAAATAPQATATATSKKADTPLWVYILVGACSVVGWELVTRKVPNAWLPWRIGDG